MLPNPDCGGLRPQSCPPARLETGIVTNTLRRNPGKLPKRISPARQIATEDFFRGRGGRRGETRLAPCTTVIRPGRPGPIKGRFCRDTAQTCPTLCCDSVISVIFTSHSSIGRPHT